MFMPDKDDLTFKNGLLARSLHTRSILELSDQAIDTTSVSRSQRFWKRTCDIGFSVMMLILFAPVMLCIALLIWMKDGSPIVYSHERIGQGGRRFRCLKFRTMVRDSSAVLDELLSRDAQLRHQWAESFKLGDDPRIIPGIGHFLRKTSLDELPQLFNVLNGDMSLVGPRPIIPDELGKYGCYCEHYKAVKPGLTGLWQVGGRSATCYDSRVGMDVWYVENASVWTDLSILLLTTKMFLTGRLDGAR